MLVVQGCLGDGEGASATAETTSGTTGRKITFSVQLPGPPALT